MRTQRTASAAPATPVRARAAPDTRLAPVLAPGGALSLAPSPDALPLDAALAERLVRAFAEGTGPGLLHLGAAEVASALPAALGYWRDFAARYVAARCARGEAEPGEAPAPAPALEPAVAEALAAAAPAMVGAEYVTADRLAGLWQQVDAAFSARLRAARTGLQEFLKRFHPAWNVVGRVHLHLAENRRDPDAPFAFLATYTTRVSAHGKPQHVPLGQALEEYGAAERRRELLALLLPLQRAAAEAPWLRALVDDGSVFHPLRWTADEALRFLRDAPRLEAAGVVVRMPAEWTLGRPPRVRVTATVGAAVPSSLGVDALLDFDLAVTLDGEPLSAEEHAALRRQSGGLVALRGRWVEADRERLDEALARFRGIRETARRAGVTFAEAARLLAGADLGGADEAGDGVRRWEEVVAGGWLARTLAALRAPGDEVDRAVAGEIRATLRPYQRTGVRWLHLLSGLRLGACLADDMGLGKTLQVLALVLARRHDRGGARVPSLLVAPASLLANWTAEIERFTPSLRAFVAHASAVPPSELATLAPGRLEGVDLVVTSYGTAGRLPWLARTDFDLVVLDEAQAIKNPQTAQARAVKALRSSARIALTGTPIENRLGDLWSLFDFLNPGLLGSAREFGAFTKRLAAREHDAWAPLRDLVRPYILRRMKTDRAVIADLPEKTEVPAYCLLRPRQVALYEEAVADLAESLADAEGMERRGLVLASLLRLKQICNHPSQWLGDGAWAEEHSGKWARLREIAEVVAARQEKLLVFTQFREVTAPLAAFLGGVFGREGLVLHGGTPVSRRRRLVERFQAGDDAPFFVLSLKAGGSGLNLTAASHVVHFDRWWNPAVENQATDRAFRIGQTRNVLVHKFVCRGTVEERIDELIESKRGLARDVLEGGAEVALTELPDDELLRLVALDVRRAAAEV